MFGYLVAAPGDLTAEELARYRACYCGLCRCIKERHGQLARLSLTYDMTFLVLLLNSLYEPEETGGEETCVVHPFRERAWQRSEVTAYAADMNVAMAYLKCLDDWEDDGNPGALAEASLLKNAYARVQGAWPRQCAGIGEALNALHELERNRCEDIDAAAGCFARLMGEVLVYREDRWSDTLRSLGMALGRFLYVMDACMDLDSDTVHNQYNPFRRWYRCADNEQRFRDILKMLLGEGLLVFDRLPLVQDVGILKNILCTGLWVQFDKRYSEIKKEQADGTGSV